MATFDYPRMRQVALSLLQKFGKQVTLTEGPLKTPAYDPAEGVTTNPLPTIKNGQGVLLAYNKQEIALSPAVEATDRKLIYVGDALAIGDTYNDWRVHQLNDIDPDESGNVVYIAQMRQ